MSQSPTRTKMLGVWQSDENSCMMPGSLSLRSEGRGTVSHTHPTSDAAWLLSAVLPLHFLEGSISGWKLGALGGHALRVAAYTYATAQCYGLHERIAARFRLAAAFHDVGKICFPDSLLNKTETLSSAELTMIQTHTLKGYDLLSQSQQPQLQDAAEVALYHHENIDGSGYPTGKEDEAIPLAARIVRVADIFDAVTSSRPYSEARTEADALEIIHKGRGVRLDSTVVDAFLAALTRYPNLGERLRWFTNSHDERYQHSPDTLAATFKAISKKGWVPGWWDKNSSWR